jgi:D-alanine transaminase
VIVHLNGKLVPREEASVSVFDRGFIFGDGVYEGLRACRGGIVAMDRHQRRLRDGLRETRIAWDVDVLPAACKALLEANRMPDAFVYWQVTRGTPPAGQPVRSRVPTGAMTPTVFGYCSAQPPIEKYLAPAEPPTVTAAVVPDTRWHRGHLKSISLLGNVLAALDSAEARAQDAILVRDGLVAEGSATNVVLAVPTAGGKTELVTPSLDSVSILGGITRELLVDLVPGLKVRAVEEEELFAASEVMLVGTTSMVTSVTELNGRRVGSGKPGPRARGLLTDLVGIINDDLRLGLSVEWSGQAEAAAR